MLDERTKVPPPAGAGPVTTQHRQAPRQQPPTPEPATPAIEPAAPPLWPLKLQLTTPIEIRGADGSQQAYITELEFRQPTGADLIACGIPVSVDYRTNSPRIEPDAMAAMAARLSGKPPLYLQRMDSKDFVTLCWKLRDFFLPNFDQLM